MIKMNSKMQSLLNTMKEYNDVEININRLKEVLFPRIVQVHDCFLIDNKYKMNEDEISFNFITRMFGNRTMYEIGCNEECINNYIESNDNLHAAKVGMLVMEAWKYRLKAEYPTEEFCIAMEVNDTHTILRFHKIREQEGIVIGNDIENITQIAMAIEII